MLHCMAAAIDMLEVKCCVLCPCTSHITVERAAVFMIHQASSRDAPGTPAPTHSDRCGDLLQVVNKYASPAWSQSKSVWLWAQACPDHASQLQGELE